MNFLLGTLDVLILTALAKGPLHGYDVVEWIRKTTDETLQIEDGACTPRSIGWRSAAGSSRSGACRPGDAGRRYYRLTAEGRTQLRAGERHWTRFSEAVQKVFAARYII